MTRRTRDPASGEPMGQAFPRALAVGAALLVVAGCAILGRGEDDRPFGPRDRDGPVVIEIHNDHFNDARIYAIWNGDRRRVGIVTGKTTQTLEAEWRTNDLRLEVDLIAAGGFVTDAVTVWPGDTIFLRIPSS